MILITLLSALISSAFGQSRYILANYTLPDFTDPTSGKSVNSLSPFPLDTCVIYKVALNLAGIFGGSGITESSYGKFTCTTTSTTDDTIQFTDYGDDDECSKQDNTNDYTYYPKSEPGTEGDFSCSGSDDSVSIQAWIATGAPNEDGNGRGACCSDFASSLGVVTSTFATGVCFDSGQGYYSMGSCNGTDTQTEFFSDSDCLTTTTPPQGDASTFSIGLIDASSDYCQVLGSDDSNGFTEIALYAIMGACVSDGDEVPIDDYCPYQAPPTDEPSVSPTSITDGPTADPSMSPTAPTGTPTDEPTPVGAANVSYLVNKLIILVIGIAIYMN